MSQRAFLHTRVRGLCTARMQTTSWEHRTAWRWTETGCCHSQSWAWCGNVQDTAGGRRVASGWGATGHDSGPRWLQRGQCSTAAAGAIDPRVVWADGCQTDARANGQAARPSHLAPAQASPPAPTTPWPEAPVSITLKATLHGHEVMVTLRGTDFASIKAQVEQAAEWLRVQAPAQPSTQGTGQADRWERPGWCAKHGMQMDAEP